MKRFAQPDALDGWTPINLRRTFCFQPWLLLFLGFGCWPASGLAEGTRPGDSGTVTDSRSWGWPVSAAAAVTLGCAWAMRRWARRERAATRPTLPAGGSPVLPAPTSNVLDASGTILFSCDLAGRITAVNKAIERVLEFRGEELLGRKWTELIDPGDVARASMALERVLHGGKVAPVEVTVRTARGVPRVLEVGAHPFATNGGPAGFECVAHDVTERRTAEHAARESERQYRELVQNVNCIILRLDREGRIRFINEFGRTFFGYADSEILGRHVLETIVPETESSGRDLRALIQRICSDPGRFENNLNENMRRDGSRVWIAWTNKAVSDAAGELAGVFCVGTDVTDRVRAEQALKVSEERYRSVVEHAPWGMHFYQLDAQDRLVFTGANPTADTILGTHCSRFIGLTLEEAFPEFAGTDLVRRYREVARGGEPWHAEVRYGRGAAQRVYDVSAFRGSNHTMAAAFSDVTERKRAEEALRASEERFRAFMSFTPAVAFMKNGEGRYVAGNQVWADQFRSTVEESLGKTDFDLWPEATARQFRETDLALLRSGQIVDTVQSGEAPDGTRHWWSVLKFPIRGNGADSLICGIVSDITERKRSEEALAANEALLRGVVSNVPVVLFALDPSGHFTLSDGKGLAALGLKPGQVVGQSALELYQDNPTVLHGLREALAGQERHDQFEVADRIFECWLCPVKERSGKLTRVIGVAADITERRRLEMERLNFERKMQQAQKLESLGVLAGGIAHDFNNLLCAILGNLDLALQRLPPSSPVRTELLEATTATHRAADLAKQMLAYSGKGHFVVQNLDLRGLIEEMVHMLQVSVSKKATLRLQFADNLPAIRADATQLRQVIMNLVINSSEAIGDREGVIAITTGVAQLDTAALGDAWPSDPLPAGRYVTLEVADTGCGIARADLNRIFDPFYTTKFTGRGLGLAAVQGIVRGHNGGIHVESEPGKGTTFKVLFQAVNEPAQTPAPSAQASQTWHGQGTILVVDDKEIVRFIGKKMLERLGFGVLTASDGREGVEVYRAHEAEIVCVFLDLTMPRMNGEETFTELRRIHPDVRVVLSSGYSEQEVSERFAGLGLAGFVQKPFTLESLTNVLKTVLPAAS